MAGADKQGRVVARDLLTGEPHVLFTAETANNTRGSGGAVAASMDCDRRTGANNTRGGGGAVVASMDCDRRTGVFAVATGDVSDDASSFVDIYTLSKARGDLATGLVGDV